MYEGSGEAAPPGGVEGRCALSTAELTGWVDRLSHLDMGVSDVERVDQLRVLEMIKSACAAAQARVTVQFAGSQRATQVAAGVKPAEVGRGIGSQVALARRDSPVKGGRHLGLAQALVREMPHTLAALQAGLISEWRATIVVRETACLSGEDRGRVDAELAARLAGLGDLQTEVQARAIAYRLDPAAFMARVRGAVADRRVTCRPAPDTMARLTGFVPAALGVAAYAALRRDADTLKSAGDERSRDQIMADLFFARLTAQPTTTTNREDDADDGSPRDADPSGAADHDRWAGADGDSSDSGAHGADGRSADAGGTADSDGDAGSGANPDADSGAGTDTGTGDGAGVDDVPVEVQLIMTDRTLFGGDDEPALLQGYGPIPAGLARRLVRDSKRTVWLRRLYTRPADGGLVGMDSRRRIFPERLRRWLIVRDQTCRTPWCDAPIRHADHIVKAADGGPTTVRNGQGLCEACNYVKAMPGWTARLVDEDTGEIETSTPTGHSYRSHPPPLPGTPRRQGRPPDIQDDSQLEQRLRAILHNAA